jgi:hypothetical protein
MRMKYLLFLIALICSLAANSQKPVSFFSFGLDYRQYPIDIENVPRGQLPRPKGLPSYNLQFWKIPSVHSQFGALLKKNWVLTGTLYSRYNLLNRTQNVNYSRPPEKVKRRNNFKYDFFLDIEKKLRIKKDKEKYFLASAGIGFTNINSKFDVTLIDTTAYGNYGSIRYHGTMFHFGPRISLGYQYKKLKITLNAYIIEDPELTNLNSLWTGATISYVMILRKKKKGQ